MWIFTCVKTTRCDRKCRAHDSATLLQDVTIGWASPTCYAGRDMSKTLVELTDDQVAQLEAIAARDGRTLADVVRESVEAYLATHPPVDREELKRRFLEAAGMFHSGVPDLAVEHDKYFAEAIEGA